VILLGGRANALSVARHLGRLGAAVYALNEPGAFLRHSRYCHALNVPVDRKGGEAAAWAEFLLGSRSDHLRGAVLLACSDEGIEVIADHRAALAERFLLDISNPQAQRQMLDKLATYRAAVEAGVPTPGFWVAESRAQLAELRDSLAFPLIVKPRLSHVFEGASGKKLVIAQNFEQVAAAVEAIAATGTDSLLMEMIPGPDDRLCSYFTYLDEDSRPLFDFTKRIIRRYPVLMGTACYHVTDRNPEVAEWGNRLFRHVGLTGLANVEFKRDVRDGKLKLIECNARFTASDCLVARAGVNLAVFVYNRLTGRPAPDMGNYKTGLRLWDPIRDFQAYLQLRKTGEMTFARWLASVMHRQTFPYFRLTDPMPALARLTLPIRKRLGLT
jgi:predicted ATP-grasp superfamily ATP-dependent carboligase